MAGSGVRVEGGNPVRMLVSIVAPLLGLLVILNGCSVTVAHNGDVESGTVKMDGIVNGYASIHGLSEWDGNVVDIGVLKFKRGEIVHVEIWPLVGVGVGVAGVRLRVLPFEVGIGSLSYHPKPPKAAGKKSDEDDDDHDDHDNHDDDDDTGEGGNERE